jgi:hypothetical protein
MKVFLEKIKKLFNKPHYILIERTKGEKVTYVIQYRFFFGYEDLDVLDTLEEAKELIEILCKKRKQSKIKPVDKLIMGSDC